MEFKDKLKEKGLDLAEDQVKSLVEAVFEYAEFICKESENKFDDAFILLLPSLKSLLLQQVDKIKE